jgi:hypothetical protein
MERVMEERRTEPRSPTYLRGQIRFGSATTECVVRNMSGSGARLVIDCDAAVPSEFELTIPQKHEVYTARTVWRRRDKMGIKLTRSVPAAPGTSDQDRLRKLERANALLRRRLHDDLDSPV